MYTDFALSEESGRCVVGWPPFWDCRDGTGDACVRGAVDRLGDGFGDDEGQGFHVGFGAYGTFGVGPGFGALREPRGSRLLPGGSLQ